MATIGADFSNISARFILLASRFPVIRRETWFKRTPEPLLEGRPPICDARSERPFGEAGSGPVWKDHGPFREIIAFRSMIETFTSDVALANGHAIPATESINF